jgi:hypothetical protein
MGQCSHLSVYGTDSPYIGRFVRVRPVLVIWNLSNCCEISNEKFHDTQPLGQEF